MFTTTPDAEDLDEDGTPEDGRRMWRRFRQPFDLPWFHVSIAEESKGSVLFASELSDWISIPQRPVGNGQRVTQARLCSPGWLNGSGGWKMEVLREIWEGLEPSRDEPVLVFFVEDGGRYVDSEHRTDLTMLRDLARIYLHHSQIGSRPMGISGGRRG